MQVQLSNPESAKLKQLRPRKTANRSLEKGDRALVVQSGDERPSNDVYSN